MPYSFRNNQLIPGPTLPNFLQPLARRIAKWLGIPEVRWQWQRSVAPVPDLRYSITFRTLPGDYYMNMQ